jgi:hypothetical protein
MLISSNDIRKFANNIELFILLTVGGIVTEIEVGLLVVV